MEDFPHFRAYVGSYYAAFEMLYDIQHEGIRAWRARMHAQRAMLIPEDCTPPRAKAPLAVPKAASDVRLPDGTALVTDEVVSVTPLEKALPGTRFANLFPDRVRIKMRDGSIHILRCSSDREARTLAADLTERILSLRS
jgi:hypothetical protein